MPIDLKDRKNKLRMDLITPGVIVALAEVLTMGAGKYTPNNWQHVKDPVNTYYGALMRHLMAWRSGEKIDKESGLHHIKHVLCNAMFLLYFEVKRK